MKYIIFLFIMLIFIGCKQPHCTIERYTTRLDRIEQAKFIENVVKNATFNLTTCDYEDVDDTIRQASNTAYFLFYHKRKICYDENNKVISIEDIDE